MLHLWSAPFCTLSHSIDHAPIIQVCGFVQPSVKAQCDTNPFWEYLKARVMIEFYGETSNANFMIKLSRVMSYQGIAASPLVDSSFPTHPQQLARAGREPSQPLLMSLLAFSVSCRARYWFPNYCSWAIDGGRF